MLLYSNAFLYKVLNVDHCMHLNVCTMILITSYIVISQIIMIKIAY